MKDTARKMQTATPPSGAVYFFGGIGALVYYIQTAQGFWGIVLAFLKSIVWPALVTYDLLKFIK